MSNTPQDILQKFQRYPGSFAQLTAKSTVIIKKDTPIMLGIYDILGKHEIFSKYRETLIKRDWIIAHDACTMFRYPNSGLSYAPSSLYMIFPYVLGPERWEGCLISFVDASLIEQFYV